MKYRIPFILLFCFFVFHSIFPVYAFAGSKKTPTKKPFKIVITNMGGDYPSDIMLQKNRHPYDISEEVFSRMLNNFDYKKKTVTGWEKRPKRVFHEKVAKYAGKYLRRAFLKVRPGQKVVFTNYTSIGETLCDIFIQKETINWKFITIHGDSRNRGMWMLVRGYLQEYYGSGDKLLSAQGLFFGGNYVDAGWMQIPLLQLTSEMKNENELIKGGSGKEELDGKKSKLEKLKKLAALYRKKLITQKELIRKGKDLMKERAGERLDIEGELEYLKLLKDEKIITRDAYVQRRKIVLEKY